MSADEVAAEIAEASVRRYWLASRGDNWSEVTEEEYLAVQGHADLRTTTHPTPGVDGFDGVLGNDLVRGRVSLADLDLSEDAAYDPESAAAVAAA